MGLDKNFTVGRFAVLKSQNHDTIVGACHEILEVKGNTGPHSNERWREEVLVVK